MLSKPSEPSPASLLSSGGAVANPSEALGSQAMRISSRLSRLRLVVFDAAPTLPVPDALGLAANVDGTVVVRADGRPSILSARFADGAHRGHRQRPRRVPQPDERIALRRRLAMTALSIDARKEDFVLGALGCVGFALAMMTDTGTSIEGDAKPEPTR